MALTPLNTDDKNFPLSDTPYLSRVSTHYNDDKNYAMLSFNPGFALQAAELNEIQELFFMNLSLTQRMNGNWILLNTTQTTPFSAPFWEGLIPLSPDYLTISSSSYVAASNELTFSYSLSAGWYLYTDKASKLSFWIYNSSSYSQTTTATNGIFYFGTRCGTVNIGCCQTDESCIDQDVTLRDGSQESYQEFTCGASRFKINANTLSSTTLESFNNLALAPSDFCHIFTVDLNSTNKGIKYPNGYIKTSIV